MHQLLVATILLKLKTTKRNGESVKRYDISKLNSTTTREDFRIDCRNRFVALDIMDEGNQSIDERWKDIRNVYQTVGKEILGFKRGHRKKWITDGI